MEANDPSPVGLDTPGVEQALRNLDPSGHSNNSNSVFADESLQDGSVAGGPKSDIESHKSTTDNEDSSDSKPRLARKETIHVFRLRGLVFLVLAIAAVTVSLIVYRIMWEAEQSNFEQQYASAAEKIETAFLDIINVHMSAISSLGVAIIAHGRDDATQKWPYVTVTSFQERATTAREQSGVLYVHLNPEVQPSKRAEWEMFAANKSNAGWM